MAWAFCTALLLSCYLALVLLDLTEEEEEEEGYDKDEALGVHIYIISFVSFGCRKCSQHFSNRLLGVARVAVQAC